MAHLYWKAARPQQLHEVGGGHFDIVSVLDFVFRPVVAPRVVQDKMREVSVFVRPKADDRHDMPDGFLSLRRENSGSDKGAAVHNDFFDVSDFPIFAKFNRVLFAGQKPSNAQKLVGPASENRMPLVGVVPSNRVKLSPKGQRFSVRKNEAHERVFRLAVLVCGEPLNRPPRRRKRRDHRSDVARSVRLEPVIPLSVIRLVFGIVHFLHETKNLREQYSGGLRAQGLAWERQSNMFFYIIANVLGSKKAKSTKIIIKTNKNLIINQNDLVNFSPSKFSSPGLMIFRIKFTKI